MRTIYVDNDFRCYLTDDGTRKAVETDAFDGRCRAFIEGYRFVPIGETWTNSKGVKFRGEYLSPVDDYNILIGLQKQFEEDMAQTADMQTALDILGVTE